MTLVQRQELDNARAALATWMEVNGDKLTGDDLDFLAGKVLHRIDDALAE